jgi:hypothetical protein
VHNGIWDANDLRAFKDSVEKGSWNYWKDENGVVNLRADIDMKQTTLEAIGVINDKTDRMFTGNFNGNNYKIYNVNLIENKSIDISSSSYAFSALFGVAKNVRIENLRVEATVGFSSNPNPNNKKSKLVFAGGIIGYGATDTVTFLKNCSFSGQIKDEYGNVDYAGGLMGWYIVTVPSTASIDLEDCHTDHAAIAAQKEAGGLVGNFYNPDGGAFPAIFKGCYVLDTDIKAVNTAESFAGGIIGELPAGANIAMSACYVTESQPGTKSITAGLHAGGFIGFATTPATLTGCYNSEQVQGSKIGVLAGKDNSYVLTANGFYGIYDGSYSWIGEGGGTVSGNNNGVFTGSSASNALNNFYGGSALNDLNAALTGSGYQYEAPNDKASYPILIKQ